MSEYNAEETAVLARAFDIAWNHIEKETADLELDTQRARADLSKKIMELAAAGQRDEQQLVHQAVNELRGERVKRREMFVAAQYRPALRNVDLWERSR